MTEGSAARVERSEAEIRAAWMRVFNNARQFVYDPMGDPDSAIVTNALIELFDRRKGKR